MADERLREQQEITQAMSRMARTLALNIDVRGEGRTRKAMLEAPQNCFYVVHNSAMLTYCRALQSKIRRPDIRLVTWEHFLTGRVTRGALNYVVMDHFTWSKVAEGRPAWNVVAEAMEELYIANSRTMERADGEAEAQIEA